jgi:hypothetical protein
VQVDSLSFRPDDHDELHATIERAEPVRGPGRELGGLAWLDEFWDERYRGRDQLWSGRANPQLVAQAGALAPGTAIAGRIHWLQADLRDAVLHARRRH